MYIMCVCLFSAVCRRVGALQISIIIIIIIIKYNGCRQGKRVLTLFFERRLKFISCIHRAAGLGCYCAFQATELFAWKVLGTCWRKMMAGGGDEEDCLWASWSLQNSLAFPFCAFSLLVSPSVPSLSPLVFSPALSLSSLLSFLSPGLPLCSFSIPFSLFTLTVCIFPAVLSLSWSPPLSLRYPV